MKVLAELKQRKLVQWLLAYAAGAWLLLQVIGLLGAPFDWPDTVLRSATIVAVVGFFVVALLAWYHGERGAQKVSGTELVLLSLLLLIGGGLLWQFAPDGPVPAPAGTPAAAAPGPGAHSPAVSPQSIAVLAFANMSADKDNEYFSDGVAEEILNALAKVDELKVAGRTSSFYFKGRNEPLATIGSTLGVAHVLEGSVRKQGERLRISAKLLRVSDGVELWADTFDGTDGDIFALQESIARQVTSQLKVALNAGQGGLLVEVGTADPEAYALHLRATDIFNRRAFERYPEGIADAERALALDPQFARAHSRLGALYYLSAVTAAPEAAEGFLERASRAAESALALNPALAEPRAVLGVIAQNRREYAEAREAYSEALRLDTNDPTANLWDALARCYLGYIAQCEQRLDQTLAIDPLLPNALGWRSRLYVSAGDIPAAERMVDLAREVGLRWTGVSGAWIALARGDTEAARLATADTNAVFGAGLPPEAANVFAGARVGDPDAIAEARRVIDAHLGARPARINALVPLTLVRIGEVERGLELFASRPTSNDPLFLGEVMGTRLVPTVWASPAFPEFLRKTGIAGHWDAFGAPGHCRKAANGDYRCE